ncbi:MAG: MerR family transcriptional regulator [Candidatus Dormiibacterota bacterium]
MPDTLTIGEFSRVTHLSVKSLRHYQKVGLLEPVDVDPGTGYRHYTTGQIPTAQVIRRFRSLHMPVEAVKAVLTAPDHEARNALIAAHLNQMEDELGKMQLSVASLRSLLEPSTAAPISVEHRTVPATTAAGIQEIVDLEDLLQWYQGALGELYAIVAAQDLRPSGPSGGLFSSELFQYERGEATVFVPLNGDLHPIGRVASLVVPAAELAMMIHHGQHTDIDVTYGALGTYVTEHELAVDGPVREYYPVDARSTEDAAQWRTEIGWPIFQTEAEGTRP